MRDVIPKYRGFVVDKVVDEAFPSWVNKSTDSNLYLLMASMMAPFETVYHAYEFLDNEREVTRASLLDTVRFYFKSGSYSDIYRQTSYDNHGLFMDFDTDVVRLKDDFFNGSVLGLTFKTRLSLPTMSYIPSLFWDGSDIKMVLIGNDEHFYSLHPFNKWGSTTISDEDYVEMESEYYVSPNYYNDYLGVGDESVVSPVKIMKCDRIKVVDIHHRNEDGEYYSWLLGPGDVITITAYKSPMEEDEEGESYPYTGNETSETYYIKIHFTEAYEFYIEAPASPTYYIEKYIYSRILYDSVEHNAYISSNPDVVRLDDIEELLFRVVNIEHHYDDTSGDWVGCDYILRAASYVDEFLTSVRFTYKAGYVFEDDDAIQFQNTSESITKTYLTDFSNGENSNWSIVECEMFKVVAQDDIYQNIDGEEVLVYPKGTNVTSLFSFSFDEGSSAITFTYNGDNLNDLYCFKFYIGYTAESEIEASSLNISVDSDVEYDALKIVLPISSIIEWNESDMSTNMLNRDKFLQGSLSATSIGKVHLRDFCYVKDSVVLNNHQPVSIKVYEVDRTKLHIEYANDLVERIDLVYGSGSLLAKSIAYFDGYVIILADDGHIYKFDMYNNDITMLKCIKNFSNYNWIRMGVGNNFMIFSSGYCDIYRFLYERILYDFDNNSFVVRR